MKYYYYQEFYPISQQIKLRRLELDIEALQKILQAQKVLPSVKKN